MKIEKIKNVLHIECGEAQCVFQEGDCEYAEKFCENLNAEYADVFSTELTLKNSVSTILEKANEGEEIVREDFLSDPLYQDAILESTARGILYHSAMQCYALGESDDAFTAKIANKFDIGERSALDESKLLACKHKLDGMISGQAKLYQEQKFMMYIPYNEIYPESACKDKVLVQGIVDLIIEFDDKVILVDYKTNKTVNRDRLLSHYAMQLELYRLAIMKSFHKDTTACLYAFSIDDFIFN